MNDLYQKVSEILATYCRVPAERIRPDDELRSLDLDSLSLLEVALGLQKEFEVPLDEDEVSQAGTVADLVGLVELALAGRSA